MAQTYKVELLGKLDSKTNVARIMQPANFHEFKPSLTKVIPKNTQVKPDGPIKSKATVSSRLNRPADPQPEYLLEVELPHRRKQWRGRSEDSGKFAIAYLDDDVVKIILVDHWYKFGQILDAPKAEEETAAQGESAPIGKLRKQKKDKELIKEIGLSDSEEEVALPKKRARSSKKLDEEAEGMDYDDRKDDDEVDVDVEEVYVDEPMNDTNKQLSQAGEEIKSFLNARKLSSSSEGLSDDSSDGISPPQPIQAQQGLTKNTLINQLIRLGKVRLEDLLKELARSIGDMQEIKQKLPKFLSEVSDKYVEGGIEYFIVKEEFRRSMPSHGERIDFQSR